MNRGTGAAASALIIAMALAAPGLVAAQQGRVVQTLPKPQPRPPTRPPSSAAPPVATTTDAARAVSLAEAPEKASAVGVARPGKGYAERLAGASDCEEFARVAAEIEDGRDRVGKPAREAKGEFETSAEFVARYRRGIVGALDGATIIALKVPSSASDLTYDADRGVFKVSPYGINSAVTGLPCASSYCSAYSAPVKWEAGAYYSNALEFEVPRAVAEEVKRGHYLVVGLPIGGLRLGPAPYGTGFVVTIDARCVVLVGGGSTFRPNRPFWFAPVGRGGIG